MMHGKKSARIVSLATVLLAGGLVALAGMPFVGFKAAPPPVVFGSDPAPVAATPHLGGYSNSGCLGVYEGRDWVLSGICPGDDEFQFTVSGSTLHVLHKNAEYNCCVADIAVELEVMGDEIVMSEVEVPGDPCDCDCCYNVESSVVDLAPGSYTVEYCWWDYYSWEFRCVQTSIVIEPPGLAPASDAVRTSADPAGVAQKARPQFSKESVPFVSSYSNSGCLWGVTRDAMCVEDDTVQFTAAAGTLHALHSNASYNCCLDDTVVSVAVDGSTIILTEEEILTEPCWCICCYDVEATVAALAPGTYTVVYCWLDDEEGLRCYSDTVVIP